MHFLAYFCTVPFILYCRRFNPDLYNSLCKTVGGKKFIRSSVTSPFWIYINYELLYDKTTNELLPHSNPEDSHDTLKRSKQLASEQSKTVDKIAVCYHNVNSYTRNSKILLSSERTLLNCLTLEGYKVIFVDYFEWSKLSMTEENMKINYLLELFEEQNIHIRKFPQTGHEKGIFTNGH